MDPLAEAITLRHYEMEKIRRPYEPNMQNCVNYVNPRRYDFSGSAPKGQQRKTKMYDGVAQDAFLSWVDGILGWYVSQSQPWVSVYVPDRKVRFKNRVVTYCQDYAEQLQYEIAECNFYARLPEFLRDGAGSGTGCGLTEEAKTLDKANIKIPHPASVYILEDDEGHVCAVHLKSTYTARQARTKFNKDRDRLPKELLDDAKDPNRAETEYEFIHAIFKADDSAISDVKVGTKPWASIYVVLTSKNSAIGVTHNTLVDSAVVRRGGWEYNPASVWRFRKNSDEVYGYSPAMDVMCAISTGQQIGRQLLHMGNLAADPPKMIPEELRATYALLPGGKNFYTDPQRLVSSIQSGGEYPIAKDREDAVHDLVRTRYGYQFWHAMTLLAAKKERVPATQVTELRADQAMMLVGQVDNLGNEGIAPFVDNIAAVADRGGRLPDPPPELDALRGKNALRVKFIGPLALFQDRLYKTGSLKQALQLLAGLAQTLGPGVFDSVRDVELTEYMWESSNAPRNLLRDKDEVFAVRKQKAQAAQLQQAAETGKTMAEGLSKLSKGAEPASPLAQLVGA